MCHSSIVSVRDRTATTIITAAVHPCTVMMMRRLENRSATTPPRIEKVNRPKLIPVATAESASGLSSSASTWKTITMVHIPVPKDSTATAANREAIVPRSQWPQGTYPVEVHFAPYQGLAFDHRSQFEARPFVNVTEQLPIVR